MKLTGFVNSCSHCGLSTPRSSSTPEHIPSRNGSVCPPKRHGPGTLHCGLFIPSNATQQTEMGFWATQEHGWFSQTQDWKEVSYRRMHATRFHVSEALSGDRSQATPHPAHSPCVQVVDYSYSWCLLGAGPLSVLSLTKSTSHRFAMSYFGQWSCFLFT
jgi:hypothetical protein